MSNIITLKVRTWDIDFLSSYFYVHVITCIFSGNSYPKCSDPQWTFLQTNISIIVPMEILQANDTLYTIHPVPLMPRWVNKWKFKLWFNIYKIFFLWNIMNEYGNPYIYLDATAGELRLSQLSCTCFVYKYKWPDWFCF